MRALATIFFRVWRGQWRALALGILLSVATLAAGIALLGLSGWFITAAGMAGLAGRRPRLRCLPAERRRARARLRPRGGALRRTADHP